MTYKAFISYRHVDPDQKWAKWLHNKLETYRIPSGIIEDNSTARLGRIFRDEEELSASSDLSREINHALEQSEFLIVVCSTRTPESKWVNEEIIRFRELGRHDQILALLIEGEPDEAFPKALREIRADTIDQAGQDNDEVRVIEPLAADMRFKNGGSRRDVKRLAFLRIVAALLGRRFDELRQRDQERKKQRLLQISFALSLLLVGIILLSVFAVNQKNIADRQQLVSDARMLVTSGESEFEDRPLTGLRIAIEGVKAIPESEHELKLSLLERVSAIAEKGRIMKVGNDVEDVYHQWPEFPFMLVRNQNRPDLLLHIPDFRIVTEINVKKTKPLYVTPSLQYFAVPADSVFDKFTVHNGEDATEVGGVNTLSNEVLIPNNDPIYFVGDSSIKRISDSNHVGKEGFDIKVAYQTGATAFALFYRDYQNEIKPPPPEIIDIESGKVLQVLPKETEKILFDEQGSAYFVLVKNNEWQLRRIDRPGEVFAGSKDELKFISFSKNSANRKLLLGFWNSTEVWKINDNEGVMIDKIDTTIEQLVAAEDGNSWIVQIKNESELSVLSLDDDKLKIRKNDVNLETDEQPLFVPVNPKGRIDKSSTESFLKLKSIFDLGGEFTGYDKESGLYDINEQDQQIRQKVWQRGQNNRKVYYKTIYPNDSHSYYLKQYYRHGDMGEKDLIYTELYRKKDNSLIYKDERIKKTGLDPSGVYVWIVLEGLDDDNNRVIFFRLSDGEEIWKGSGDRVIFTPYPSAEYFIVNTRSGIDKLISTNDGKEIAALNGSLRRIDYDTLSDQGYFIAEFWDDHYELWNGNDTPFLLNDLGHGLRGYMALDKGYLMIWFDDRETYVIDSVWLAEYKLNSRNWSTSEFIDSVCNKLFNKPWFDRQIWLGPAQVAPKSCTN